MEETKNSAILILVVDDEASVIRIVEFVLAKNGYQVITAANAAEALAAEARYHGQIQLALIDYTLPDHDGCWVAAHLAGNTGPKIAIMSGYLPETVDPSYLSLPKPFTPATLISKVQAFLTTEG